MEGYAISAVSPTTKTSTGRVTIVVHSRFSHCVLHVRSSQRVMILARVSTTLQAGDSTVMCNSQFEEAPRYMQRLRLE
eukprot:3492541-Amphidinium_carterae.1